MPRDTATDPARAQPAAVRTGRWRDLPLKQKSLLLLLIPSAALLLGFVLLYGMNRLEADAIRWVRQSLQVRDSVSGVLDELVEAENATRAFVATREEDFLAPYHTTRADVTRRLTQLERLLADNPVQAPQVQVLRSLVERRLEIMRELVAATSAPNGGAAAATIPLMREGKAAMQRVQEQLREIDRTAAEVQTAREERLQRIRRLSLATSAGSVALGVLGGIVAVLLFARSIVARVEVIDQNATRLAEGQPLLPMHGSRDELGALERSLMAASQLLESRTRALRETQRELETALHTNQLVLQNSRDVICTIDADGRFRSVSAAAEQVWGYTPQELIGRAYMDLVEPGDYEKTRNAAAAIIAGDSVTDFDNCYVRKDGSLVHIMWSAHWSPADNLMYCVARDVTERARADREVKQARQDAEIAREQAEQANRAKSEFLSRMSHELRTPLNAILGFAQVMEMDERSEEDQESINQILRAGRHLLALINDVLDLSRIEAGRLSISPEAVSVPGVLRQCAELMAPLARAREIDILLPENGDGADHVRADRQRLTQVLLNLIANAVKYNRHGGTVTLSYQSMDGQTRILVRDTGLGIRDADTHRLFQPFDRLGAETESDIEGTGLGLALSKRLVELMHGRIGFDSVPEVGSTFWVEFPVADDPIARSIAPEPEAESPVAPGAERTVLYIEDNPSNLKLVERVLKSRPHLRLISAMQGGVGVLLARQHAPDLVMLDLNLPDASGADILAQLQNDPATSHTPVIIISADATEGQIRRLRAAGAAAYLVKPLDVPKLLQTIDEQLKSESLPA
jgi:PAS domain S-box-containing protein